MPGSAARLIGPERGRLLRDGRGPLCGGQSRLTIGVTRRLVGQPLRALRESKDNRAARSLK